MRRRADALFELTDAVLTADLASVVQDTVQPEHVLVWLRPDLEPTGKKSARDRLFSGGSSVLSALGFITVFDVSLEQLPEEPSSPKPLLSHGRSCSPYSPSVSSRGPLASSVAGMYRLA
jgi:hypothetical protein